MLWADTPCYLRCALLMAGGVAEAPRLFLLFNPRCHSCASSQIGAQCSAHGGRLRGKAAPRVPLALDETSTVV